MGIGVMEAVGCSRGVGEERRAERSQHIIKKGPRGRAAREVV